MSINGPKKSCSIGDCIQLGGILFVFITLSVSIHYFPWGAVLTEFWTLSAPSLSSTVVALVCACSFSRRMRDAFGAGWCCILLALAFVANSGTYYLITYYLMMDQGPFTSPPLFVVVAYSALMPFAIASVTLSLLSVSALRVSESVFALKIPECARGLSSAASISWTISGLLAGVVSMQYNESPFEGIYGELAYIYFAAAILTYLSKWVLPPVVLVIPLLLSVYALPLYTGPVYTHPLLTVGSVTVSIAMVFVAWSVISHSKEMGPRFSARPLGGPCDKSEPANEPR